MALLAEGQRIRDTYEVERFLGEGAFAEVYRVRHRFLGQQAMKVLKAAAMTLDEIEGLLGEAILLSRIGHPNIVRVFDANLLDSAAGTLGYFTMEYVPGGSLDRYWRSYQSGRMPIGEAVDIMRQVCSGLSVAHSEDPPIVHRDIKPQNILIGYDGAGLRVRVSDFGLAKRVNPLTLLASSRGTMGFKPPEAMKDMDSCAADVWAIGTTFYLLLTGTLPFPYAEAEESLDPRRFERPLRPASLYNIEVDAELDRVLERCLALSQSDRYPNAQAVLEDLLRWQAGVTRTAAPHPNGAEQHPESRAGAQNSSDREWATEAVQEAMRLAREPGKLMVAADMLEEALIKAPDLREVYESRLKLWRRGVSM
jgi:serine/threonine-protein kinase